MADEPRESLEAVRLEKLERIAALGIDPWGQRFKGHQAIASVRAFAGSGGGARQRAGGPQRTSRRANHAAPRAGESLLPRTSRLDRTDPDLRRQETGRRLQDGAWSNCSTWAT